MKLITSDRSTLAERFFTTRLAEIFESGLVLAVRFRPVVLAGFLEELAASLRQGYSDSFLFADDLDPEHLVPENLNFSLCRSKCFAWTLAHRFSISSAVAIPFDVVSTFFVEFGPAIDQDVVWPNATVTVCERLDRSATSQTPRRALSRTS